jgi:hypothetical protein
LLNEIFANKFGIQPMRKLLLSAMMLGAIGFLASCSDEGGSNNNNGTIDISGKTKQEVFMMHSWKLTSWIDSGQGEKTESIEQCKQDDVYDFTSTTSFKVTNNQKCDPSDKDVDVLSWGMPSPNGDDVNFFGVSWKIKSLSGEKITLNRKYLFNFPSGSTDTLYSDITLVKK